ncbi:MAG TPA: glycine cleavage system aminomethyltransferase GcvT [Bacteroidota bacterium]|nr:glycine cleavage system aminomethyltransferase GcvT [Bacteroidota bacterium]
MSALPLKRTAFHAVHTRMGAKIVEFAGFEMPVQYTGIIEEHRKVREAVGLFDVSHMGEVELRGRDALAFVQKITINDASKLAPGAVQYSAMCYDDGGIVDDLLVYNMGDHYMLVINAANTAKDIAWMQKQISGDVSLIDRSDAISLLALQGPASLRTLKGLTDADLDSLAYYHWTRGTVAGVDMIISRTGYTGELGFELYFPSDVATGEAVWNAIMNAGRPQGIGPVGLGARDTLRLEMGYCLYGHDIDQTTNPIEAGLGWITKLSKGDFIGKAPIQSAKEKGPVRKLIGFVMQDRAFPRQGYGISNSGASTGTVTSGTFSPVLGKGIGMGYVAVGCAKSGTPLSISIRDRDIPGVVSPIPFIKK